jgi:hypothetical protein
MRPADARFCSSAFHNLITYGPVPRGVCNFTVLSYQGTENLLQPQHPLDRYHQSQLDFRAALPQEQRAEHARLFRLGNASYRYQQEAVGEITETDYLDWLERLPTKLRRMVEQGEGLEPSKSSLALRRHARERRDQAYSAFVQAILSPGAWASQQSVIPEL